MYIPKDLSTCNVLTVRFFSENGQPHNDTRLVMVTGGFCFRFPDVLMINSGGARLMLRLVNNCTFS